MKERLTEEVSIEPTHSFEIKDAKRLGSVEKAILLKEIRRMSAYKTRHDEEGWVYYSSRALEEKFPYLTYKSIQRWLKELEDSGDLEATIENRYRYDRTKSYRTPQNEACMPQNEKACAKLSNDMPQNGTTIPPLSSPHTIIGEAFASHVSSLEEDTTNQDIPDDMQILPEDGEGNLIQSKSKFGRSTLNRTASVARHKPRRDELHYDFDTWLDRLRDSHQKTDKIVALIWKEKGYRFENYDQWKAQFDLDKHFASLLKGYSGAQIQRTIDAVKEESVGKYDWKSSSVLKKIAEIHKL